MESAKDKQGKTEEEFLRDYDVSRYFRPSVTVDAILYRAIQGGVRFLAIKRGGHPFIGKYAFPGGFVEENESCETGAARELYEETGISDIALRQLVTVSTPGRDPRHRNITAVFCAEADDNVVNAVAGDDADDVEWFDAVQNGNTLIFSGRTQKFECKLDLVYDAFGNVDINNTKIIERGNMAFDHAKIVSYLLNVLSLQKNSR